MDDSQEGILFVNDLWGYGTVTMAMAISDELQGQAPRLFAGTGPGFELARHSGFDRLLRVDTMATPLPVELDETLRSCKGVVSVMNKSVADHAARHGIPCVYVDCLLWAWATPPEVPKCVPYFQESFPGSAERLAQWREHFHEAEIVGPLVARHQGGRPGSPDVVLINFGGLSSSRLDPSALVTYAQAMAECAVTAVAGWTRRVVIAVGAHIARRIDQHNLYRMRPDVDIVELGHDAYLAELRRAAVLVSSAGMHAIYEACSMGVPVITLPAQNLDQVLALEILMQERATDRFDWQDLYGVTDLTFQNEIASQRCVAEQISRFSADAAGRNALVRHIHSSFDPTCLRGLRERQSRFFAARGTHGARRIADRLMSMTR